MDETRQKAEQLNQLLEDADCTRRELLDQHNKVTWESQQTQKVYIYIYIIIEREREREREREGMCMYMYVWYMYMHV